ncbi:MAG TPA: DUF1540 domain-containing protein [Bacillota bacterium]|nr:DUF1540 domain-containing protein [Bacillota bacterium]
MDNQCQTIKCSVDSCEYWDKGNYCGASGIEVDNIVASAANNSMEIGSIGSNNEANQSEETCCRTFKPKSSK